MKLVPCKNVQSCYGAFKERAYETSSLLGTFSATCTVAMASYETSSVLQLHARLAPQCEKCPWGGGGGGGGITEAVLCCLNVQYD